VQLNNNPEQASNNVDFIVNFMPPSYQ